MLTPAAINFADQRKMPPNQQKTGARIAKTLKIIGAPSRKAQWSRNFSNYIALQL
jgi:hypothetical protein